MLGIGTLLALILWVILGGFISYYGDIQGSRWGKKRVSWLGLRPKHTARLITSLTGAAISLLSIISLLAIMPAMRDIVLHGEGTLIRARTAEKQLKTFEKQIIGDASTIGSLQSEKMKLSLQTETMKQQNTELLQRRDELLNRVKGDEIAVKSKEAKVAELNAEKRKYEEWNHNAAQSNKDLAQQNIDMSRVNAELTRTNTDLQSEKSQLEKESKELIAANTDLIVKKKGFDELYQAADKAYRKLLDDNEHNQASYNETVNAETELRKEISELARQRDMLAKQRDTLSNQNENLIAAISGTNQGLSEAYFALREGKMNVHAGGELGRTVIDAHSSPSAVIDELQSLMDKAAHNARQLGAVEDRNGRVVLIVSKHLVTAAEVADADENASLNALKENIAGSDLPVVVIAHAINNNVMGERILIELTAHADVTIFRKGEVVAAGVLNARNQADGIVQGILAFLQKDVRDAAIAKGLIPKINPENGELEVGMENYGDLFALMQRIHRLGGSVKIEARAKADTKCGDTLQLEFKVSRADKPLSE